MSAFERFGRKTAKEIGPPLLIGAVLVGLIALGAHIPFMAVIAHGVITCTFAIAAAVVLVRLVAVLWAGVAPAGRFLGGFLPMRVWQIESPWDSGPWHFSAAGAAEFIHDESDDGIRCHVTFTDKELRRLWLPGRTVERDDWSITCKLIQRRHGDPESPDYREWDGW